MQLIFVIQVITACDQLHQAFVLRGDVSYYLSGMSTPSGFDANKMLTNKQRSIRFNFSHISKGLGEYAESLLKSCTTLIPVRRKQADL